MENNFIVHCNRYPEDIRRYSNYGEAIITAMNRPDGATISDETTGAILYVTYKHGDIRVFITTVNGEVRIAQTK